MAKTSDPGVNSLRAQIAQEIHDFTSSGIIPQGWSSLGPTSMFGFGQSPLHLVVETAREDVLGLLLDHGVNLNKPDERGRYPLDIAIRRGEPSIVKLLLEKGADVSLVDVKAHVLTDDVSAVLRAHKALTEVAKSTLGQTPHTP